MNVGCRLLIGLIIESVLSGDFSLFRIILEMGTIGKDVSAHRRVVVLNYVMRADQNISLSILDD